MTVTTKWWILFEDEPLDIARSRVYDLADGQVRDGRTGELVGCYEMGSKVTRITLNDEPGDNTVYELYTGSATPEVDACGMNWTTTGFELYRANWPIAPDETEEAEWAREDWENEHFGQRLTFGGAVRDGPHVATMHAENQRGLATVH